MDKEGLFLIYVNVLGSDWKGETNYEFIFSDTTKDVDGEDWDLYPASGQPSPPRKDLIKAVGVLTPDCINALAWENITDYEVYPERRLSFMFGQTIKSVEDKKKKKDFVLEYKVKSNGPKKEDRESISRNE